MFSNLSKNVKFSYFFLSRRNNGKQTASNLTFFLAISRWFKQYLFIENTYMYVQYIMVQNLTVSKVVICKPSPFSLILLGSA